jgi:hypothetical protein
MDKAGHPERRLRSFAVPIRIFRSARRTAGLRFRKFTHPYQDSRRKRRNHHRAEIRRRVGTRSDKEGEVIWRYRAEGSALGGIDGLAVDDRTPTFRLRHHASQPGNSAVNDDRGRGLSLRRLAPNARRPAARTANRGNAVIRASSFPDRMMARAYSTETAPSSGTTIPIANTPLSGCAAKGASMHSGLQHGRNVICELGYGDRNGRPGNVRPFGISEHFFKL